MPFVLVLVGFAITIASLGTQVETNYATYFANDLAPGNVTLALPAEGSEYLVVNLTMGVCDLRLYPATDPQ